MAIRLTDDNWRMDYKSKSRNRARAQDRKDKLWRRAARGNKAAAMELARETREDNIKRKDRRRAEDKQHELNKMKLIKDHDKKKTKYIAGQDRGKTKFKAKQDKLNREDAQRHDIEKTKYTQGQYNARQERGFKHARDMQEDRQNYGREQFYNKENAQRERDTIAHGRRLEEIKQRGQGKSKGNPFSVSSGGEGVARKSSSPMTSGGGNPASKEFKYDRFGYMKRGKSGPPPATGNTVAAPNTPKAEMSKSNGAIPTFYGGPGAKKNQNAKTDAPKTKKFKGREITLFGAEGQPRGVIATGGNKSLSEYKQDRAADNQWAWNKIKAETPAKPVEDKRPMWAKTVDEAKGALGKASKTLSKYDAKGNLKEEHVAKLKKEASNELALWRKNRKKKKQEVASR